MKLMMTVLILAVYMPGLAWNRGVPVQNGTGDGQVEAARQISSRQSGDEGQTTLMFWNLENFFDWKDDGTGESDTEFSATGARHWTAKRFYTKSRAIAKTVLWVSSQTGELPDVIGVAEIENAFVLKQLLKHTILRKADYRIVHYDSPDTRGIDCGLLYRSSALELVASKPCRVSAPGLVTRDILLVQFRERTGDSLAVLVNHHPSKYGGGEDWRREAAIDRLRALTDSLSAQGWVRQVAVGDFNDTPENPLFSRLEPSLSLCRRRGRPEGSIRFNGLWELIDLCFVSPPLAGRAAFYVLSVPFLTERDAAHSGERPLRTYSGPRYLGGVSDHCPIIVSLTEE